MRPCLDCGEPSAGPRCPEHGTEPKGSASERGYDWTWTKLSKRARRLQPFCTICGSVEDLQVDHLPSAWERHQAGKPIRLTDVQVVCAEHNRGLGSSRPGSTRATRGNTPPRPSSRPRPRQSLRLTPESS